MRTLNTLLIVSLLLGCPLAAQQQASPQANATLIETKAQRDRRMSWWREA